MARAASEPDPIPWLQAHSPPELPHQSRIALASDHDLMNALDATSSPTTVDERQDQARAIEAEQKVSRIAILFECCRTRPGKAGASSGNGRSPREARATDALHL